MSGGTTAGEPRRGAAGAAAGARILVVEDDASLVTLLVEQLRLAGPAPTAWGSGVTPSPAAPARASTSSCSI